jgi:hypothetical protein
MEAAEIARHKKPKRAMLSLRKTSPASEEGRYSMKECER